MKNQFILYGLISIILTSCSTEVIDSGLQTENTTLSNYIFKTYNINNTPNTVIDSVNFTIENNRIISSSNINLETSSQQTATYNYTNDKIDEVLSFRDGALNRIQSYTYDGNDNLVVFLSESINSNNESFFNRHTFTHTTDTIFSSWKRSEDGINFNVNVSDSKIVLNTDNNRLYFEEYDHFNNDVKFETNTYDANSNSINDSKFLRLDNGNDVLSFENNYTTTTNENLFNSINEATFTRKNMMLLFHLQSDAVNEINAKSISKNNLATFQSTWGNSFASFEITNTNNENGVTIYSDFRTIISGNLFARFSHDFILSEN